MRPRQGRNTRERVSRKPTTTNTGGTMLLPKTLKCLDEACGKTFESFSNRPPKHCPNCSKAKRPVKRGDKPKQITCAVESCRKQFETTSTGPVKYCPECREAVLKASAKVKSAKHYQDIKAPVTASNKAQRQERYKLIAGLRSKGMKLRELSLLTGLSETRVFTIHAQFNRTNSEPVDTDWGQITIFDLLDGEQL